MTFEEIMGNILKSGTWIVSSSVGGYDVEQLEIFLESTPPGRS